MIDRNAIRPVVNETNYGNIKQTTGFEHFYKKDRLCETLAGRQAGRHARILLPPKSRFFTSTYSMTPVDNNPSVWCYCILYCTTVLHYHKPLTMSFSSSLV